MPSCQHCGHTVPINLANHNRGCVVRIQKEIDAARSDERSIVERRVIKQLKVIQATQDIHTTQLNNIQATQTKHTFQLAQQTTSDSLYKTIREYMTYCIDLKFREVKARVHEFLISTSCILQEEKQFYFELWYYGETDPCLDMLTCKTFNHNLDRNQIVNHLDFLQRYEMTQFSKLFSFLRENGLKIIN